MCELEVVDLAHYMMKGVGARHVGAVEDLGHGQLFESADGGDPNRMDRGRTGAAYLSSGSDMSGTQFGSDPTGQRIRSEQVNEPRLHKCF